MLLNSNLFLIWSLYIPLVCGCPCKLRFNNLYCKKPGSVSNFPEDILSQCSRMVIYPEEIRGNILIHVINSLFPNKFSKTNGCRNETVHVSKAKLG